MMIRPIFALLLTASPLPVLAQNAAATTSAPPSPAAVCASIPSTATLLPCGWISTNGNQTVNDQGVPVRLVGVGWRGTDGLGAPMGWDVLTPEQHVATIIGGGFNVIRLPYNDAHIDEDLNYIQQIVAIAGPAGLRVIIDHHTNDAGPNGWGGQQANGLWFDSGPGTDGTDGSGTAGTVTAQMFQDNWVRIARMFAGNPTVIGFDLDNEPFVGTGLNWGKGGPTDIRAMYETVGNAILAVNPDVLIICEAAGVFDWTGNPQALGFQSVSSDWGNLTSVATNPVRLSNPRKLVYSVHEYPADVNSNSVDAGPAYIAAMNQAWGFIYSQNIAPIWIGEIGSSMNNADDKAWADTITAYLNGNAPGGLVIPSGGYGPGTSWWCHGHDGDGSLDGTLEADWHTYRPEQDAVFSQFRQNPATGTYDPTAITRQLGILSAQAFPNATTNAQTAYHAALAAEQTAQQQRQADTTSTIPSATSPSAVSVQTPTTGSDSTTQGVQTQTVQSKGQSTGASLVVSTASSPASDTSNVADPATAQPSQQSPNTTQSEQQQIAAEIATVTNNINAELQLIRDIEAQITLQSTALGITPPNFVQLPDPVAAATTQSGVQQPITQQPTMQPQTTMPTRHKGAVNDNDRDDQQ